MRFGGLIGIFVFVFSLFSPLPVQGANASLSLNPTAGAFTIGDTFSVSVLLNTGGEFVNAIDVKLLFPSDKLQIASPSAGQSVVGIWTAPPSYDNSRGVVSFRGGIPNPGINAESGLISTITFRVKALGTATIRFSDDSKVFLNDGKGTNILGNTTGGIYQLVLPPPAGPFVVSETHPVQERWYKIPNAVFRWSADPDVGAYSYMLSDQPIDFPDDISEGAQNEVVYRNLPDGVHYFHIKSRRSEAWGGTTHFGIKVDTTPPSEFPIEIIPGAKTSRKRPVISFTTTDADSGLSHYEIKIIPLTPSALELEGSGALQEFFVETQSPYLPGELKNGRYQVVVRAYDIAGNFREVNQRLEIVTALFERVVGEGIRIRGDLTVPWIWVMLLGIALVIGAGFASREVWLWHRRIEDRRQLGALRDPVILRRLRELQEKRKSYAKAAMLFFAVSLFFGFAAQTRAQSIVPLSPPVITSVSENLSNDELFYIGGKTEVVNSEVILYMQNLQTGETITQRTQADKNGDWFLIYPKFLISGRYLAWVQNKVGDQMSPPGPQIQVSVAPTALELGGSRLTYETLYFGTLLLLILVAAALVFYALHHARHARRKHGRLMKEIREAEESIKRGLVLLRQDIAAELAVIHRAKLNAKLSEEEKEREKKLLADLEWVSRNMEKEVWDIEKAESGS